MNHHSARTSANIGGQELCTIIYDLYMTHGNIKLDCDYGDDEICRAQSKDSSERVEEYTFPAICSFELDSPVKAK